MIEPRQGAQRARRNRPPWHHNTPPEAFPGGFHELSGAFFCEHPVIVDRDGQHASAEVEAERLRDRDGRAASRGPRWLFEGGLVGLVAARRNTLSGDGPATPRIDGSRLAPVARRSFTRTALYSAEAGERAATEPRGRCSPTSNPVTGGGTRSMDSRMSIISIGLLDYYPYREDPIAPRRAGAKTQSGPLTRGIREEGFSDVGATRTGPRKKTT